MFKYIVGIGFVGGLAALLITISNEIKAVKSTVFDFSRFYNLSAAGNNLKGKLELSINNGGEAKLKIKTVNLQFLYGNNNLGGLENIKSFEITKNGQAVAFDTVLNVKPISKLLGDFFKTSKIPITVVGTVTCLTSALGTTYTQPISTDFDLKEVIKDYSPDYIKALFDVFK